MVKPRGFSLGNPIYTLILWYLFEMMNKMINCSVIRLCTLLIMSIRFNPCCMINWLDFQIQMSYHDVDEPIVLMRWTEINQWILNISLSSLLYFTLFYFIFKILQIIARAKYSISFGGASPEFSTGIDNYESLPKNGISSDALPTTENRSSYPTKNWLLFLPKAYHPLLVQQHREKLKMARNNLKEKSAVSKLTLYSLFSSSAYGKMVFIKCSIVRASELDLGNCHLYFEN